MCYMTLNERYVFGPAHYWETLLWKYICSIFRDWKHDRYNKNVGVKNILTDCSFWLAKIRLLLDVFLVVKNDVWWGIHMYSVTHSDYYFSWSWSYLHHHHWLYSPGWALVSSFLRFRNNIPPPLLQMGLLASHQTPNLEGQGIAFYLGHHPWHVWWSWNYGYQNIQQHL